MEVAAPHGARQTERGAQAVADVTSLVAQGNLIASREVPAAYVDGSVESVARHTPVGRDFHS
jgi:hypothetical protein